MRYIVLRPESIHARASRSRREKERNRGGNFYDLEARKRRWVVVHSRMFTTGMLNGKERGTDGGDVVQGA